jgi:hypothetical protein
MPFFFFPPFYLSRTALTLQHQGNPCVDPGLINYFCHRPQSARICQAGLARFSVRSVRYPLGNAYMPIQSLNRNHRVAGVVVLLIAALSFNVFSCLTLLALNIDLLRIN